MYVAVRSKLPIFHWSLLQNISKSLQLTTQAKGPLASMRAGAIHYVAVRLQNTAGHESLGDDGQYHLLSKLEGVLGEVENEGRITFKKRIKLSFL